MSDKSETVIAGVSGTVMLVTALCVWAYMVS